MAMLASDHFRTSFAPLFERYGSDLRVRRDGNTVCWSLGGRSAVVELHGKDFARATFVDRPVPDGRTASPTAALYRGAPGGYRLAAAGCAQMADDLVAFFSGVREPKFAFVGLRAAGQP